MGEEDDCKWMCSLCSFFTTKCSSVPSSLQQKLLDEESHIQSEVKTSPKKPGWKAIPYIIGIDTIGKLAVFGIGTNFMVYLLRVYNMDQVLAANILNTWTAVSNVVPLIGAFVADAYLGKFLTIAIASFSSLLGMVIVMLTAWVPQLHPPACSLYQQQHDMCISHTNSQLGVLLLGLVCLAIGIGGTSPCSIPFAIDQFDLTTVEGRQGTKSFYNLYYNIVAVFLLINLTLVVNIQDSFSWTLGFGLYTMFMSLAIILFFASTKIYAYVEPKGSIFSSIAQVLVAAKHKYYLHLPAAKDTRGTFYEPPLEKDAELKLPLTEEFRCLNKAALIVEGELNGDGTSKYPWRLCSIQQVEELKCLFKTITIWVTGIIVYIPVGQLGIFPISQALKMDRHLGHNFEISAGSLNLINMLTLAVFLPLYDRVLTPSLAKITKQEGGFTTLQRIGLGHVFGILSMVVSGMVEQKRRSLATSLGASDGVAPMSFMWLAPQFILLALIEAFFIVGHTEFFNEEFPDNMRSIGNALICFQSAIASNLSSFLVNIIHNFTGKEGQHDWLDSDINKGRLEYFYYIIAGMGLLNFIFFIFFARRYSYKTLVKAEDRNQ